MFPLFVYRTFGSLIAMMAIRPCEVNRAAKVFERGN
jgi:hypothetical protein